MSNKAYAVGITLLLGFIGYGVWKVVLKERLPLLSYSGEIDGILRLAEETIEKSMPPRTDAVKLKRGAAELRAKHDVLIERAGDSDKHRPSYRKIDEIVMQIEYAAQQPDSADVVEARFRKAREGMADVKSLLGTPQDEPTQP